jgi:hypothetical protein
MDRCPAVIACDNREAFAQGSGSDEAIQPARVDMDCFAGARSQLAFPARLDDMADLDRD